ncbi:hypothetical protein MKZ38_010055 [Zalerion maritima]|uniref:1,3-beta-glucanosyltransferase n=1 Tax=Zalerion maritima TaxID=339359 RepID=A0AAD5RFM2_9PEZI|nr:hypothetical protein MKZ38_010055 [Zalerion maritima]
MMVRVADRISNIQFTSALLGGAGLAGIAAAVPSLEVKNNFFVNPSTNKRFQVVGVAYQPGGSAGYNPEESKDPLSDGEVCKRDAALMQTLGLNAIRVYNLNPDINHDECASVFNAAGMYMLLDVNSPLSGESINSGEPWTSYYASYLNRTFAVVEAFKDYPNTLAFFAGNEVIDNVDAGETVPPYMRAVTRDLKNYIAKHSSRSIPVGYSAADVRDILFDSWNYLQCSMNGSSSDMSHADLFALNSYSWCGESSFTESGYNTLVDGFQGSTVPVFYSEYGCNEPYPRLFDEVQSIYSSNMTDVFSGGIVYEYSQETSNYGLVKIYDNGTAQLLDDYHTLANQLAKLDFESIQDTEIDDSLLVTDLVECEASLITEDSFNDNFTIPSLPPNTSTILENGVDPAPSGSIISIDDYSFSYTILDVDGAEIADIKVAALDDNDINSSGANGQDISSDSGSGSDSDSGDEDAAAGITAPTMGVMIAAVAGMLAVL